MKQSGIVNFAQFRQRRNQKLFGGMIMTSSQIELLITTIRQLIQKARNTGDSGEYYRLSEELCMAQAALNTRPALNTSALAFV